MSREIQAGVKCDFAVRSLHLEGRDRAVLHLAVFDRRFEFGCFGPQNGVSTQRVPLASSQVASEPQMPAEAKLTISLQISGVR